MSNSDTIRFFGTYVPWHITKHPDNIAAILYQYREGWPSYTTTGFYIPIYTDLDKVVINQFKTDYAIMFREMMGRIARSYGLIPFSISPCGGMPDNLIDVFGIGDCDFKDIELPKALIKKWENSYMFKGLKDALPFITIEPGLYEVDLGEQEAQYTFRGPPQPHLKDEELKITRIM